MYVLGAGGGDACVCCVVVDGEAAGKGDFPKDALKHPAIRNSGVSIPETTCLECTYGLGLKSFRAFNCSFVCILFWQVNKST